MLALICAVAMAAVAQATSSGQRPLRIAAAADLQPVLPDFLAKFTSGGDVHVDVTYQSSATLATQIINGAPFDLFLAADLSFPQRVIAAGLADEAEPVTYARGTLVLWTRNDSRFHDLSMDSLRDSDLKSLAVANAEHAPYGRAAQAALTHLGIYDQIKSKLVIAENIAQTAQYVDSGNAELGLISLTSALTPRLKASGHYVVVPRDAYPPILQGAVVVKRAGANSADAQRFLDFLLSAQIQSQLAERGLAPAK
jgi:molybdate transport system substrate-binding protein